MYNWIIHTMSQSKGYDWYGQQTQICIARDLKQHYLLNCNSKYNIILYSKKLLTII